MRSLGVETRRSRRRAFSWSRNEGDARVQPKRASRRRDGDDDAAARGDARHEARAVSLKTREARGAVVRDEAVAEKLQKRQTRVRRREDVRFRGVEPRSHVRRGRRVPGPRAVDVVRRERPAVDLRG